MASLRDRVIDFLKGGPAKNGIAIFAEHGNDAQFLRLCKMNPRGNRPLLEKQLCTIAGISNQEYNTIKNEKEKKTVVRGDDKRGSGQNSERHPLSDVQESGSKTTGSRPSDGRSNAQKLRDQYPFLSQSDCPPELHQLVSMKITAYHNYVDGHKLLFDASGFPDCLDKAKYVVDNFKENRAIEKELDYYKKQKQILGLHPIFASYQKIKGYNQMNVIELVEKLKTLEHNIWRIESEIKKNDKPHLKGKRELKLQLKQMELAELKRMLNVPT